jgi:hypothetical protein
VEPDAEPYCETDASSDASSLVPYRDAAPVPMPFVHLGAPQIETIQSPEEVRRKLLAGISAPERTLLSCAQWNSLFSDATGVSGPDVTRNCYDGEDPLRPVPFDRWWAWVQTQPSR